MTAVNYSCFEEHSLNISVFFHCTLVSKCDQFSKYISKAPFTGGYG